MAAITIRNIDDDLRLELRKKAAANSRSMEAEVRAALRSWVQRSAQSDGLGLGTRLKRDVQRLGGGTDFRLPDDEPYEPLAFDEE